MIKYLTPPKTPLKLALYSFVWFVALSTLLFFVAPQYNGKSEVFLFFCAIGFAYGRAHGVLPYKKALLTNLWFIIPLFAITILPALPQLLSGIDAKDMPTAIPFLIVMLVAIIGLQLVLNALGLWMLSKVGARKKVGTKKARKK